MSLYGYYTVVYYWNQLNPSEIFVPRTKRSGSLKTVCARLKKLNRPPRSVENIFLYRFPILEQPEKEKKLPLLRKI